MTRVATEEDSSEMGDVSRDVVVDAVDIINDIFNDLTSAGGIYLSLMARKKEGVVGFRQEILDRVILGHMAIALSKVHEVLVHPTYAKVLGSIEITRRRVIRKEISRRSILDFRSTCIGHIHCDKRGRPVRTSEMEALRLRVMDKDMDAFLAWAINGEHSVRTLLLSIRDQLARIHKIEPQEILDR